MWGGTVSKERRVLQREGETTRKRRSPKLCHCGAPAVGRGRDEEQLASRMTTRRLFCV